MKPKLRNYLPAFLLVLLSIASLSAVADVPQMPGVDISDIVDDSSNLNVSDVTSKLLSYGGRIASIAIILSVLVGFAWQGWGLIKRAMDQNDKMEFSTAVGLIIGMLIFVVFVVVIMGFIYKYAANLA